MPIQYTTTWPNRLSKNFNRLIRNQKKDFSGRDAAASPAGKRSFSPAGLRPVPLEKTKPFEKKNPPTKELVVARGFPR